MAWSQKIVNEFLGTYLRGGKILEEEFGIQIPLFKELLACWLSKNQNRWNSAKKLIKALDRPQNLDELSNLRELHEEILNACYLVRQSSHKKHNAKVCGGGGGVDG